MKQLTRVYQKPAVMPLHIQASRPPLREALLDAYAKQYLTAGKVQNYAELLQSSRTVSCRFEDLPHTEIAGFPIASGRNAAGELRFTFDRVTPNTHVLGVGTTGSGKTTALAEPGLRAVSAKKNKPNLFLTDPKGEIFRRNAAHLREQGYRLIIMNFKDVRHSDCWNPLAEIYDCFIRQKGLKEKVGFVGDRSRLKEFEVCEDIPEPENGFWVYGRNAYATLHAATEAYRTELDEIRHETTDMIRQLIYILIPDKVLGSHDPSWFLGAREILSGVIFAMLEDALDDRTGFTRDNMNLMTVQQYFDTIRRETINDKVNTPLLKTKTLSHKNAQCESIKELTAYFQNASNTSRSYAGCFTNSMQNWFNSKIFALCNGNSVSIDANAEKPFAVFLITRDYESSDFTVAGMFIDWIYRKLIRQAEENGGSLNREMFYILDEFAQIPPIEDFDKKISTARSRNIWFLLFIQSYSQLETSYNAVRAKTIIENCNTFLFLGSRNFETKERFSRECGARPIFTFDSMMNPDANRIAEVPLVTVEKLDSLQPGQMYMKRTGFPLTLTEFLPTYRCRELTSTALTDPDELGLKTIPFSSEQYTYSFLNSSKSLADYAKNAVPAGFSDEAYRLLRMMI